MDNNYLECRSKELFACNSTTSRWVYVSLVKVARDRVRASAEASWSLKAYSYAPSFEARLAGNRDGLVVGKREGKKKTGDGEWGLHLEGLVSFGLMIAHPTVS